MQPGEDAQSRVQRFLFDLFSAFAGSGLSMTDMRIWILLGDAPAGISASAIAQRSGRDRKTIRPLLTRMIQAGHLHQSENGRFALTDAGRSELRAMMAQITKGFSPDCSLALQLIADTPEIYTQKLSTENDS